MPHQPRIGVGEESVREAGGAATCRAPDSATRRIEQGQEDRKDHKDTNIPNSFTLCGRSGFMRVRDFLSAIYR